MRTKSKSNLKDKNLALVFTAGTSLKSWHEIGSLEREVALYNKLSKHFNKIYFFTYGGSDDLQYNEYLSDNIIIIPKKTVQNNLLYSLIFPIIHYKLFKNIFIIKTNQMIGSWSAVLAKILFGSKLVIRTGYMLSINYKKEHPQNPLNILIKLVEMISYKTADAIITTTKSNFEYVKDKYNPKGMHIILPNYIDTELFRPLNLKKQKNSICFVGRLNREKNLFSLLDALKGSKFTVDIYGSGPLEKDLKKFSEENEVKAFFRGNVANHKLPIILNQHEIFILVSYYENMPKSLIEAMACGIPIVGTNVKGINETITDGADGILCETDKNSIKTTIDKLMNNNELKEKLGRTACENAAKLYSLENITQKEYDLYHELLE